MQISEIKKQKWSTTKIIAVGYVLVIAIGTILLMLPVSGRNHQPVPFMDAWFTATSATCVTGLVTHDTYTYWSSFGQVVLLILVQIGGMGFMTIAISAMTLTRKKIGLSQRLLMQESVGAPQVAGVVRMSRLILGGTVLFEGLGAVLLSFYYIPRLGLGKGLYFSLFHSISAFCNAGIDLMGYYQPSSSLTMAADSYLVGITIALLILIGGIGFLVWEDALHWKWRISRYRLHSKVVLAAAAVLVVGGTLLIFLFEYGKSSMEGKNLGEQILCSFFQAVTPRTAGFNTMDLNRLTPSSQMLMVCFMFIGGSPGSTAGGIKTTTLTILLLTIWTEFKKRKDVELFKRRVEGEVIRHAACILMFYGSLAFLSSMVICALEGMGAKEVIFEVVSALCTVGLSLGITAEVGTISHVILILLMFIGRVGGITILIAFSSRLSAIPSKLPAEKIAVG
nr:TrkH family potassium uptake protein [uncultured Blautia sp.]